MATKLPGKEKFKAPLKGTPKIIKPPSPRILYLVMALVTVVFLVGGFFLYHRREQLFRQRIEDGLSIVVQLKVEQIAEWRAERLADADMLVGSPFFTEGVAKYMASPTDTGIRDKVIARLAIIGKSHPYQDILLVDVNGSVLLSLNDSVHRLSDMTLAQLAVAIKAHKAVMVDFHYPPDSDSPHLDVIAPLFPWQQDSQQAIGAVVFCIDPSQYLYPLIQSQPVPSETAETLLVERDGDQVLFLSELRHQKDSAFKLRIPLSQQKNPAVMAVLGKEGVVEGRDYRGVEVLSALKHIPDSPWYMVAKIDTSEALSAWRFTASIIMAFVAVLLAAAFAGTGLIWQRRQRLAYQNLYQAEEALRQSEERYRTILEETGDGYFETDLAGNFTLVNDAQCRLLGYSREELVGMGYKVFTPEENVKTVFEAYNRMYRTGEPLRGFTDEVIRKDGSRAFAETTAFPLRDEKGEIVGFRGIRCDITERKQAEEALWESEERYRALFDRSPDCVYLHDFEGNFLDANDEALKLMGYDRKDIPHLNFVSLLSEDQLPKALAALEEVKNTGTQRQAYEFRLRRKDGEYVNVEATASAIYREGKLYACQGIARDLTERKRAEESLKESEQRLKEAQTLGKIGNWEFDLTTQEIEWSDEVYELYERDKALGPPSAEEEASYYSPKEAKRLREFARLATEKGEELNYDLTAKLPSGKTVLFNASMLPVKDGKGRVIRLFGTIQDVTERKQAEEALRQSEEKYRTILKEIADSYFEVDLAGNLTFVNDATCRNLRYSREELLGMNYRGFTAEEDIEHVYQSFNEVYRTGEPNKGFLWKVIRKDGSIGFADTSVSLLRSQGGEIIGFRGVGRDITERKMAEEVRKQLELKAQVTSRLASVGEMAAGVAHEINNPLTAVTGYAQLLMDREDVPPDIRSDLEAINDGARRAAGIIQRLLAFSRQTEPQQKLVDINELIESTLVLRAYHLRVNNIEVVTRLTTDVLETVADPGQIQQVLLNLIVNAETEMKLAHGKGKITITTEKSDNTIKICCQDDGPGIKPEVMDRIFDPFFTTREVGQGTGLGLSLCYGIIAEHKGKIYAESKPGKGATFVIELPIVTEAVLPKPAEPDVKKSQKAVKARILVVDDEQVIRDVVNRVLTGEGYKVETVDNAADALKKIESKRYKLILVDIKMPGISGVTLYKRIQKIDKSLARRVVFITGDIMGADTEKFLSETKVAHIDKPFDAEQLKREVRRGLTGGQ